MARLLRLLFGLTTLASENLGLEDCVDSAVPATEESGEWTLAERQTLSFDGSALPTPCRNDGRSCVITRNAPALEHACSCHCLSSLDSTGLNLPCTRLTPPPPPPPPSPPRASRRGHQRVGAAVNMRDPSALVENTRDDDGDDDGDDDKSSRCPLLPTLVLV